ncbi:spore coat protein YutH [Evansella sp. AB-P1]|uniref:spore coat putative kinase YutH n=1 Tax=Evansella sp. AB-P1 TaxID=3037653 RepID=UPI00241E3DF2|nr:spore coat protein YutH [Evansella sp. AB-P1]MDG5788896.1 spore coat protein YutH [Evansella sp. AB-P1]
MIERALFDRYGIYPEEILSIGYDQIIFSEGKGYLLRPVKTNTKNAIDIKANMAEWLMYQGDLDIATFLNRDEKKVSIKVEGMDYVVFQLPELQLNGRQEYSLPIGQRLAQFHHNGFTFSKYNKQVVQHIIPWKNRWEKRLDQLEKWYLTLIREKEKSEMDKEFCMTYPYFMGLTENAIQMMMDVSLDDEGFQQNLYNTICHSRFQDHTWLTIEEGHPSRIKVPTDFTFDHITRDIAEYIRTIWIECGNSEKGQKQVDDFLNAYESVYPLTLTDQKLLFIRLMFPIHYFKKVEFYYSSMVENEKLKFKNDCFYIFQHTTEYEQFFVYLANRYPSLKNNLSLPQWIKETF